MEVHGHCLWIVEHYAALTGHRLWELATYQLGFVGEEAALEVRGGRARQQQRDKETLASKRKLSFD